MRLEGKSAIVTGAAREIEGAGGGGKKTPTTGTGGCSNPSSATKARPHLALTLTFVLWSWRAGMFRGAAAIQALRIVTWEVWRSGGWDVFDCRPDPAAGPDSVGKG